MKNNQFLTALAVTAVVLAVIFSFAYVEGNDADGEEEAPTVIATIGTAGYGSLAEAIEAAEPGATVTLVEDAPVDAVIIIDKNLTIDLNGHSIAGMDVGVFDIATGDVTLSGLGTITTIFSENLAQDDAVIHIGSDDNVIQNAIAHLAVGKNVSIFSDACQAISIYGNATYEMLDVYGKVIVTDIDQPAIYGNGDAGYGGTVINIHKDSVVSSEMGIAVFHPQAGDLSVQGIVMGVTGIMMLSESSLQVGETAAITSTSDIDPEDEQSPVGYAIVAFEDRERAGNPHILILAGTVIGGIGIVEDEPIPAEKKATITVTGGAFSEDVSEVVAEGYLCYLTEEGYAVKPANDLVAVSAGCNFLSFVEAMMLGDGDVVLKKHIALTPEDIEVLSEPLEMPFTVTVSGNFDITLKDLVVPQNLDLVLNGPTLKVSGQLLIDNGASLTASVDFGGTNKATLTGLAAGASGFHMTKGSVKIGGDIVGGTIVIRGEAVSEGLLNIRSATMTLALDSSLIIPAQSSVIGDGNLINNGMTRVYGMLSMSTLNDGTLKAYPDSSVAFNLIQGNAPEKIEVDLDPIEDMTVTEKTYVVVYLSALPSDAVVDFIGAKWLRVDGHKLVGYAPEGNKVFHITVTAYLPDSYHSSATATQNFDLTVEAAEPSSDSGISEQQIATIIIVIIALVGLLLAICRFVFHLF